MQKIVIIGSGPAGLSAGISLGRSGFPSTIISGEKIGGQIIDAVKVDNCPGFKIGSTGKEIVDDLLNHVKVFNVNFINSNVISVDFKKYPFEIILKNGNTLSAEAVIVATGKTQNQLLIPNSEKYLGYGLSYCATCDGPFFKNQDVCVVGGGDNAVKSAMFLSDIAKNIHIFVRGRSMRASFENQQLLKTRKNIYIHFFTEIKKINGEKYIEDIDIIEEGIEKNMKINGIFVMIGSIPNTEIFENILTLDEQKYIITDNMCRTNINGVFAAGDVQAKVFKQFPIAVGNGTTAAMAALAFLK